jgi:uncharacterized lipoprotein NlpE involved in copper resistance
MELRVTMLCVNTPVVTFQTISRNDNLTLKFRSRHTFAQTAVGVILILFERACSCSVCCFVVEATFSACSATNTHVSIVITSFITARRHCKSPFLNSVRHKYKRSSQVKTERTVKCYVMSASKTLQVVE